MIELLSQKMRELIAAGEVVERPASVVKELVENSIDAGARAITVSLEGGGLVNITVTDDGCGIPREDVERAFLRSATSKIRCEDDLQSIATLGFRGEALASICSVSRVRMITKTKDAENGAEYIGEAGETVTVRETACREGTSVSVADLFYNTPVRMKFLKSDSAEGAAAEDAVEQQALAHPEIAITLIRDGKPVFETPGDNRLSSAIFAVFPRGAAAGLREVDDERHGITVSGYVSVPEARRASRSLQYCYVNGRYVKDKTITAAVENGFSSVAGKNGYPAFVINVDMPRDAVDVNVHPAKTTVRFADERGVFSAVYGAVAKAVAALPETQEAAVEQIVSHTPASIAEFVGSLDTQYEPSLAFRQGEPLPPVQITYKSEYQPSLYVEPEEREKSLFDERELVLCGEIFSTYIICARGDDMVIIDKHAAHERILFERFSAAETAVSRQLLLVPVVVELSRGEKEALFSNVSLMEALGFVVEEFGEKEAIVREIPVFYSEKAVRTAVEQLAHQLFIGRDAPLDDSRKALMQSISCRAAVKAGDHSEPAELMAIAKRVLSGEIPKYCPHGRPVCYVIKKKELETRFERG